MVICGLCVYILWVGISAGAAADVVSVDLGAPTQCQLLSPKGLSMFGNDGELLELEGQRFSTRLYYHLFTIVQCDTN